MSPVSSLLLGASLKKRKAAQLGCRAWRAGDFVRRGAASRRAELHLSDKGLLAARRFVYAVFSFHPERKRHARVKKLEVIEMKTKEVF